MHQSHDRNQVKSDTELIKCALHEIRQMEISSDATRRHSHLSSSLSTLEPLTGYGVTFTCCCVYKQSSPHDTQLGVQTSPWLHHHDYRTETEPDRDYEI